MLCITSKRQNKYTDYNNKMTFKAALSDINETYLRVKGEEK